MSVNRPKLIVITPVRNEAWVLEAFLTCASSWADYIIIADQHSTDGSREIAARFPKVTLIDNPCEEWVEYECRARLLEEAAKITGDKIIFGIDADEFLSEGFDKTDGWKRIIESKPNEIFYFNWLNIYNNFHTIKTEECRSEWVAHYSENIDFVAEYRRMEKNAVHASRVPSLSATCCRYTFIPDIQFVHVAKLNHQRTQNKIDFYQVVNFDKNPVKGNPVAMYRAYNKIYPKDIITQNKDVLLYRCDTSGNCNNMIGEDTGLHFIEEIAAIMQRESPEKFAKLGIWNNPDILTRISPPHRSLFIRLAMFYLTHTQCYSESGIIHIIDSVLKRLVR